jgi:hypothetical protein
MCLKLFLKSLVQLRQFLLPLAFELLPQSAFHHAPFLAISRFELGPSLLIKMQSRLADRRIHFAPDLLLPNAFSITQDLLLLRVHLQPPLGVPAKHLPVLW